MGDSRLVIPLIIGILILGTPGFYPLANAEVGDIFLADNNGRLLKVTPSGDVTEILTGLVKPSGVAINSNGDIIFTESSGRLSMVQSNGGGLSVIADSGIGQPLGVKIDSDDNFIVVDNMGRLLKVTPGGSVSVIASVGLTIGIIDVAFDLNGDYVVTNSFTSALLRVTPSGSVSTIADGFVSISNVDVDSNGNFIVTSSQLLKVTPDGNTITQIAAIPGQLSGVAIDSDDSILVSEQTTGSLFRVVNGVPILIVNDLGNPLFFDIEQFVNNPPDCSDVVPDKEVIRSNSHKTVDVTLSGFTDVDGDPVTFSIDTITQDEPTNGLGDGDQSPDGFGVGTDDVQIRAERSGKGDGRVYEISFTANDGNGGNCSGSVSVSVPHDKAKDAVDSGQDFDSTLP